MEIRPSVLNPLRFDKNSFFGKVCLLKQKNAQNNYTIV